jgi:hypothetical protein
MWTHLLDESSFYLHEIRKDGIASKAFREGGTREPLPSLQHNVLFKHEKGFYGGEEGEQVGGTRETATHRDRSVSGHLLFIFRQKTVARPCRYRFWSARLVESLSSKIAAGNG